MSALHSDISPLCLDDIAEGSRHLKKKSSSKWVFLSNTRYFQQRLGSVAGMYSLKHQHCLKSSHHMPNVAGIRCVAWVSTFNVCRRLVIGMLENVITIQAHNGTCLRGRSISIPQISLKFSLMLKSLLWLQFILSLRLSWKQILSPSYIAERARQRKSSFVQRSCKQVKWIQEALVSQDISLQWCCLNEEEPSNWKCVTTSSLMITNFKSRIIFFPSWPCIPRAHFLCQRESEA